MLSFLVLLNSELDDLLDQTRGNAFLDRELNRAFRRFVTGQLVFEGHNRGGFLIETRRAGIAGRNRALNDSK
jgi:hypothetical protein